MKLFAALLSAILVAAGTFYLIHRHQETTAAHDAFDAEMRHPRLLLPGYGEQPRPSPKPVPSPLLDEVSVTVIAPTQIKTPDGSITIPKGTVVRIVPEKSKPGTVLINYEGYVASIPENAINRE